MTPKNKKAHCKHTKFTRGAAQKGGHDGPCAVGPKGACKKSDKADGNCYLANGRCHMTKEYSKRKDKEHVKTGRKASPKKAAAPKKASSPKKPKAEKPIKQGVCPPLSPADCKKHPACSWMTPKNKAAHCKHTKFTRGAAHKGGAYSKIFNPATGKDVNVMSNIGQTILKGYINELNGGN